MGKQGIISQFGKNALSIMAVNVAIMLIILVVGRDAEWSLFANSLLFSVFVFTGGIWLTKKYNDETDKRLDKIDAKLEGIERKIDGLRRVDTLHE